MKSNTDLLEMYKEEKALVIGGLNERTGLEDFPSFKEWKLEYMKEYAETHDMDNPVSMEEAVALLEAELELEADELLDDEDLAPVAETQPEEETEMTEATASAPAAPKTVTKTATKTAKKATATSTAKPKGPSKAQEAQKVFNRMYPKVVEGKKARKDVIGEFVEKVGLTPAGAATYYQKMKKAYTA